MSFLDHGDGGDGAWFGFGELFLVVLEDVAEDDASQLQSLRAAHLGDVDDAELAVGERSLQRAQ